MSKERKHTPTREARPTAHLPALAQGNVLLVLSICNKFTNQISVAPLGEYLGDVLSIRPH